MDTNKESKNIAPLQNIGRVRMSYLLFCRSFDLLKKNTQVFLFGSFPILVRFLVIAYSMFLGITVWPSYSLFFVIFLFCNLITALSQVGIISIIDERMGGKTMSARDALSHVIVRTESIFLWSFFAAIVEVLLLVFVREFGLLGGVFGVIFWLVWEIGTFYVISALSVEKITLSTSIQNSFAAIKKNWFETFLFNGVFGFFLVMVFAAITLFLMVFMYFAKFGLILIFLGPYPFFASFVVLFARLFFLFVFMLMLSAGNTIFSIFNIVLYRLARGEQKDFFHAVTSDFYKEKV